MNCSDFDRAFVTVPLSLAAQEHASGCLRCQELMQALTLDTADSPSPATLRQIEQRIMADLRPVRPLASTRDFLAVLAAIFVAVVAIFSYLLGAFGIAVMSRLQTGAILSTLAMSAGLVGYSLVNQMVPAGRQPVRPIWLSAGILLVLTIAVVVVFQFQSEQHYWVNAGICLRTGTAIGALAGVPLWFVLRRGAMLSPSLTGAVTGLFAGLVGTTVLEIHCPNLRAAHILVGHVAVGAVCAAAGLIIGLAAETKARKASRVW